MALTRQDNPSNFSQQGTLDWVALAKAPITFSFEALARLAKAGVDGGTVITGQVTCSSLVLPPKVQEKVLDILSKLPSVALYGKVAWFGFGLRHVLYDLTEKDEGIACLTLCGCLTESYDLFFSARVLRALCKLRCKGMPSELSPGIQAWRTLLKPCAGIFSASKFPKLTSGFQRILVPPNQYGACQFESTDPEVLAQAVLLLGQVSAKQLKSCVFTGGVDCAWLAAFAEFALGLSVDIKDHEEEFLYRSDNSPQTHTGEGQVTILVSKDVATSTKIMRKCFSVPGGAALFRDGRHTAFDGSQYYSRSPWTSILVDSFGAAARHLLSGEVGGHFARLLVYLAGHPTTYHNPRLYRSPKLLCDLPPLRHCLQSPYDADLLHLITRLLPELRPCLEAINFGTDLGVSNRQVKAHYHAIGQTCGHQKRSAHSIPEPPNHVFRVAGAIIHSARILSMVEVHDILPSMFGFRQLLSDVDERPLLLQAVALFSNQEGNSKRHPKGQPLAIAESGICAWYGFLTDVKCSPMLVSRVHVVPGRIDYEGSIFDELESWQPVKDEWPPSTVWLKRTFDMLVSETAEPNILKVAYKTRDDSAGTYRIFSPWKVINWAFIQLPEPQTHHEHRIWSSSIDVDRHLWKLKMTDSESISECTECSNQDSDHTLGKLSVIHIRESDTTLDILKTSSGLWDEPRFSIEQLYAEFGQDFKDTLGTISFSMAPVSDCANCIMAFVLSSADRDWDSLGDTITGQIVIQKGKQQSCTTIKFELQRMSCREGLRHVQFVSDRGRKRDGGMLISLSSMTTSVKEALREIKMI